MNEASDQAGDLIGEVARSLGITMPRDDPLIAVVLLNQVLMKRYADEALTPSIAALREATANAIAQVERVAEAQAQWLDQENLKGRAEFLGEQKALFDAWQEDMSRLIAVQNAALESVLLRTGLLTVEAIKKEVAAAFQAAVADIQEEANKKAAAEAKARPAGLGVGSVLGIVAGVMIFVVALVGATAALLHYWKV